MRNLSRPPQATRTVGRTLANLKSAIETQLSFPDLLHFLSVLALSQACTSEGADEEGSDDYGGLEFETEAHLLETALLGYPAEVSKEVQYCLDILDRKNDSTLNFKVMDRLWSRIKQQLAR